MIGGDLFKKSAKALLIKVVGSLLAFLLSITLARFLSPDEMGSYFLALMILTILSVVCRFGLENVLLRKTAESALENSNDKIQIVFSGALILVMIIGGVITLLTYVFSQFIADVVFKNISLADDIKVMSIGIVPLAFIYLTGASLKGVQLIGRAQAVESLALPLPIITMLLIITCFVGTQPTLQEIEAMYVAGLFLSVGICLWVWFKSTGVNFTWPKIEEYGKLIKDGTPLLTVSVINILMAWQTTFLLGVISTAEEVAVYNIALRIAMLGSFILSAVNSASAAKFAGLYRAGDMIGLQKVAFQATCLSTLFSLPVLLAFIVIPHEIVSLYGTAYQQASDVLIILTIGQLASVLTGSVGQLLIMSGNAAYLKNSILIGVLVQFMMALFLIPLYGAMGAAVAEASCALIINVIAAIYVKKKLKIKSTLLGIL